MTGEPPNIVGRLGLVLYWLGCIVAAGCALIAVAILVAILVLHDPERCDYVAKNPWVFLDCRYIEPYPWGDVGLALAAGAAAWVTGRGLRFILKGGWRFILKGDEKLNTVERLGLMFYWLGYIAAAVFVVWAVSLLVTHYSTPRWPGAASASYPIGDAAFLLGLAVAAGLTGRTLRFILKGD